MQALKSKTDYFNSEEAQETRAILQRMVDDTAFNTSAGYTSNSEMYPDNVMPFVDKHMNYLFTHPKLNTQMYLTNLRLMTRIR